VVDQGGGEGDEAGLDRLGGDVSAVDRAGGWAGCRSNEKLQRPGDLVGRMQATCSGGRTVLRAVSSGRRLSRLVA